MSWFVISGSVLCVKTATHSPKFASSDTDLRPVSIYPIGELRFAVQLGEWTDVMHSRNVAGGVYRMVKKKEIRERTQL